MICCSDLDSEFAIRVDGALDRAVSGTVDEAVNIARPEEVACWI